MAHRSVDVAGRHNTNAVLGLLLVLVASSCSSSGSVDDGPIAERLPTNRVTSVAPAGDGSVWVGTHDGLGHLADDTWTIHTERDELPSDLVNSWTRGLVDGLRY